MPVQFIATPSPIIMTPQEEMIGLRTRAKGPVVTSRLGGSLGYGVPRPCRDKKAAQYTSDAPPPIAGTRPTEFHGGGNSGGSARSWVTKTPARIVATKSRERRIDASAIPRTTDTSYSSSAIVHRTASPSKGLAPQPTCTGTRPMWNGNQK